MQVKIKHKDHPDISPGVFKDSTLKVYIKADKQVVERVLMAIRNALTED